MSTAVPNQGDRRSRTLVQDLKPLFTFCAGFLLNYVLNFHSMSPYYTMLSADENSPPIGTSTEKVPSHPIPRGIFPLMRDFQCGHQNMATPRALLKTTGPGNGRIVVDVGLFSGDETLDAVEAGYIVFGFELNSGSMSQIQKNAKKRQLDDRVSFVEFEADEWGNPVLKEVPKRPDDGKGYAYIYNAGLSDEGGSIAKGSRHNPIASVGDGPSLKWTPDRVPILRLDQALPDWIKQIFFLKIDTQGYELKVLHGAEQYLKSKNIQYALYEFSPKLMYSAHSGDPLVLLQYMTSMGAVCFDMLDDNGGGSGSHHVRERPSAPLSVYYQSLISGLNSTNKRARNGLNYTNDPFGPWDDILCWFPDSTR